MATLDFIDEITLDQLEDDPYPTYAELRKHAPVAWIPAAGAWMVTSFDVCSAVGGGEYGFAGARNHPTLERVFGDPNVLTSGGETHEDLRAGIDPKLQPNPVNEMIDGLVRPIARGHLAALQGRTAGELMAEYFEPVSVDALRSVMGLDGLVDSDTLRRWFHDLNLGVSNFGLDPEQFAIADRASREIEDVVTPVLEKLRKSPNHSMLSHMLWAGREGGEPRPVELIMPSLKVILLGGMQEPGHAAGSTLLGLFGEPEQWAKVTAEPDEFIPLAVHEGLRWIAPIGAVERMATKDVEVFGQRIEAGSMVEVVLGSANRDETRFDDPDRFDMERANRVNQAFGNGEHFCAGHFFARQVQRIMFEELLPALPGLRPDPAEEPRITGWVFRAPKTMPVQWDETVVPREAVTVSSPASVPGTWPARVIAMRQEARGVLSVELAPVDEGDLPAWAPGAHIDLWPTAERAGQYSLCGDPDRLDRYRIAVLREATSGGVSEFVHERLRIGDVIAVGGPRNNFELRPTSTMTFVAGGIGITPILPMARAATASGAEVVIEYCGHRTDRLAFLGELAELGATTRLHVSESGSRADLATIVQDAALRGATIYACGPERMLTALEGLAERSGLPLVVERFAVADPHRQGDRPFELCLARSGRTLAVSEDETALEALQRDGFEIRFACRQGNCGSCETGVLDGAVDHRDVILTKAQRAKNDRMMVCVSRAEGGAITLDL